MGNRLSGKARWKLLRAMLHTAVAAMIATKPDSSVQSRKSIISRMPPTIAKMTGALGDSTYHKAGSQSSPEGGTH